MVLAHSGIEQNDAIAKVGDEHILLQYGCLGWQEVVVQLAIDFLLGNVVEGVGRVAQRQLTI